MKRLRSFDTREWIAAGYCCLCIALVAVGIAYTAGWAGDSRQVGVVAIVTGLLASVAELRRMRGDTTRVPLDENLLIPPAKRRPLTYALLYALAGLIFGLVVADPGIGVIFALAGFAVGWLSALPIQRRRRRKR